MLAPPWIPVPAPAYGGIEEVVRLLSGGLIARGHDVTLFAPPGSSVDGEVVAVLEEAHPDEIQKAQFESDHVARAFGGDRRRGGARRALRRRARPRRPHRAGDGRPPRRCRSCTRCTARSPRTRAGSTREHGPKACIVGISQSQLDSGPEEMGGGRVVHNPIDTEEWPFSARQGRLHALDRPDVARQGAAPRDRGGARGRRAARARRARSSPGRSSTSRRRSSPRSATASSTSARPTRTASASSTCGARALLMPIRWPEPFGLVMVEALACGTPVIAFPEGSVPEVVRDGVTGFVVDDEHAMAEAIGRVGEIDPGACRRDCEERFGVEAVVRGYEEVYRTAIARGVAAVAAAARLPGRCPVQWVAGCSAERSSSPPPPWRRRPPPPTPPGGRPRRPTASSEATVAQRGGALTLTARREGRVVVRAALGRATGPVRARAPRPPRRGVHDPGGQAPRAPARRDAAAPRLPAPLARAARRRRRRRLPRARRPPRRRPLARRRARAGRGCRSCGSTTRTRTRPCACGAARRRDYAYPALVRTPRGRLRAALRVGPARRRRGRPPRARRRAACASRARPASRRPAARPGGSP